MQYIARVLLLLAGAFVAQVACAGHFLGNGFAEEDRAILILHELGYREAVTFGHVESTRVRAFVAKIIPTRSTT